VNNICDVKGQLTKHYKSLSP